MVVFKTSDLRIDALAGGPVYQQSSTPVRLWLTDERILVILLPLQYFYLTGDYFQQHFIKIAWCLAQFLRYGHVISTVSGYLYVFCHLLYWIGGDDSTFLQEHFSGLTRIFANPSIWTLLVLLRVNRDFASTEGYFYTTGVQVTLFEHFNVFLMSSNGLYRWISLYHQPRSPFLYSISIFHIY